MVHNYVKVTNDDKDVQLAFKFESHRAECPCLSINADSEDFTSDDSKATSSDTESFKINETCVVALSNNSNIKENVDGNKCFSTLLKETL